MCPGLLAADGVDIVNLFEKLRSATKGKGDETNKNRENRRLRGSYSGSQMSAVTVRFNLGVGIGCWGWQVCSCDE